MNEVAVWLDDPALARVRVARLVRSTSRGADVVRFEYTDEWLEHPRAFEIDPEARLNSGPQYAKGKAGQLFGVFQDSSPDRWGKLLMDRREVIEARAQERKVRTLRAWDYLVGVDDRARMGALRLASPGTRDFLANLPLATPPMTALRELEAAADAVERGRGRTVEKWIRQLVAPGTTLGGARPKASFLDEQGQLWLAKFPSAEDRHDVGLWESLACQLACEAGIQMPDAKALALSRRGHTFAVKRFDRASGERRMYASAQTLLSRESEGASYLDLVQVIESQGAAGQIASDLEQLFRRAVFNVLIGNRDDHLRNHGFLRETTGWRLSPAFDVNPNPDKEAHVLALDEQDPTPDSALLLRNCAFFRLKAANAERILEQVRVAVRSWGARARALGLKRDEIAAMSAVIDPER